MGSSGESHAATAAPEQPEPSLIATRNMLVVVLAATSGYVDAVSYLALGHVFTSNMTGNTVLLGIALGQAQGAAALRSVVALASFLCGVGSATLIVEEAKGGQRPALWPVGVTAAFALECGVLLVFAVSGILSGTATTGLVYLLIALSAIAMGIQSAAVRTLGVSGVATTYITGTWVSLISGVVAHARATLSAGKKAAPTSASAETSSRRLQATVLAVYVVAAVAGGVVESRWHLAATAPPTIVVALVVAIALCRFPRGKAGG